jgi:hypothetical protein
MTCLSYFRNALPPGSGDPVHSRLFIGHRRQNLSRNLDTGGKSEGGPAQTQALPSLKVSIIRSLGSELAGNALFTRILLAPPNLPRRFHFNMPESNQPPKWDETPHKWDGRRMGGD